MKSEVYQLGTYLKIPNSILTAAPTDGLFGDERTDEDQIGASYDELEWAMLLTDSETNANDFSAREKEVLRIYKKLNQNNQHKMNPIPVCIINC
jgi:NAD+ synthase